MKRYKNRLGEVVECKICDLGATTTLEGVFPLCELHGTRALVIMTSEKVRSSFDLLEKMRKEFDGVNVKIANDPDRVGAVVSVQTNDIGAQCDVVYPVIDLNDGHYKGNRRCRSDAKYLVTRMGLDGRYEQHVCENCWIEYMRSLITAWQNEKYTMTLAPIYRLSEE